MIRSMTGYGAGTSEEAGLRVSVEIRSVNGRFFELSVRAPKSMASLEGRVREQAQAQVKRGNVSVVIRYDGETEEAVPLTVDVEAGRRYYDALMQVKQALGLTGDISISMIAGYPGLLKDEIPTVDAERGWACVEVALCAALQAMTAMKDREGAALAKDIAGRVAILRQTIDAIELRAPDRVAQYRRRLTDRIAAMIGDSAVDPQRLAMEVAVMAERGDITEECVRFRAHCDAFLEALEADDGAGRRLNFLLQEMNREANTVGSKANAADLSHDVVIIKEELERIREQAQNIE